MSQSSNTADGLMGAIGNTPLIRLRRASAATGCAILGKAEFMNPGGSVKDRAGLAIILDAERRGVLPPGGTVVEGTAGNTGIGLTLVGNARGYRTVIVMPDRAMSHWLVSSADPDWIASKAVVMTSSSTPMLSAVACARSMSKPTFSPSWTNSNGS